MQVFVCMHIKHLETLEHLQINIIFSSFIFKYSKNMIFLFILVIKQAQLLFNYSFKI